MTAKTMHNENHPLLGNEWEKLEELGLRDSRCAAFLSVDTLALLDDETCLEVLRQIQPEIGAPDLKVTASLVIKRIAFLTLAPMLYSMSCYNKGLDVSIENCIFEYPLEDRMWRSKMPLKNVQVTVPLQARDHWRQTLLTQAFQGNLSLLATQLNKLTRVPSAVLWENIAVRIFSIYERWILSHISQPQQLMIAQSDLAYLLNKNTTEIYNTPANPIARYHTDPSISENPSEAVRVRRTCCYYYKATEPMKFCRNCPLLRKRKP